MSYRREINKGGRSGAGLKRRWKLPDHDLSVPPSLPAADKDVEDYYARKRRLQHAITICQEPELPPPRHRQRPRRVQRALSQDHVLSPEPTPTHRHYGLSSYGGRILSEEQLLSADRLHSQDPLLSPDGMLSLKRANFREKAMMSRALSHTDMFVPTTPVMDRYKMTKMHSHPIASNDAYNNTLSVNHNPTTSKRQAFASRRTHTVDHLQYIPGHTPHHYRTASKTEVTV